MASDLSRPVLSDTMEVEFAKTKTSSQVLKSLSLPRIYDEDPRPTFIIDLALEPEAAGLSIAYSNKALACHKDLRSCVDGGLNLRTPFCSWITGFRHKHEKHYRYGGYLWFGFTIERRWRVVSTASQFPLVEGNVNVSPTLQTLQSTKAGGGGQPSQEAAIDRLKEDLKIHEFDLARATTEKRQYIKTIDNLKEEVKALEAMSPSPWKRTFAGSPATFTKQDPGPPIIEKANVNNGFGAKRKKVPSLSQPASRASSPPPIISLAKSMMPVRQNGDSDVLAALEKFQRLAEAVDVGFFDYDTSGKLLHANESWYALSGHPRDPEAHTSLSFEKCVYPDDAELVQQQWGKLLQGIPVTFEMRWRKPPLPDADADAPPEAQWVLSACVPVIGEDGEIKSISGCTTDINAQKRSAQAAVQRAEALERARASEERFSRFAAVAPIAIFRLDKHVNMEFCNERWWEITGVPKSRFEDVTWPFGVHEEDIGRCTSAWETAIADRAIGQIEFRLRKEWHDTQGRRGQAWVFCTFFAEFTEDGAFSGIMGSLLDISHLKWAENMQKARAEEALEAKRQQENFIDVTSHELRNPLGAIVQCADTIETSFRDAVKVLAKTAQSRTAEQNGLLQEYIDTGSDAAQTILSCAAHQKRIVDDILTLSKLDSNLLLITPVKTDPIEMVQHVLKMFEVDAAKADVSLMRELDRSIEDLHVGWVMLDPSRVSQILINLLGNAIKFTRTENTREVTVRMSATTEPPSQTDQKIDYVPAETVVDDLGDDIECNDSEPIYLKFEVQDTGRGLTPKEKAKLFLRFSQASPKTHVQYGGSGLGLFISRRLTELQGGEVGLTSEANVGSTFAFYVKTRRTTAPEKRLNSLSPTVSYEAEQKPSTGKLAKKPSVLLVEDNLVNQKVLSKQLERQGCTVYIAGHGVEALDFIRTTALWRRRPSFDGTLPARDPTSIDVILMDLEMPVMGGLEATSRIRQLEEEHSIIKRIPIISISANARQEQVNEAISAGVDDSISKPFRIKELMPKLKRLVGY